MSSSKRTTLEIAREVFDIEIEGVTTLRNNLGAGFENLVERCAAAINAGGSTIHSFFQLPLCPYLPDVKECDVLEVSFKLRPDLREEKSSRIKSLFDRLKSK
jgi:hypothetical protein